MRTYLKHRIPPALLLAAALSLSAAGHAQTPSAGEPGCRFAAPADLPAGPPQWIGGCASGLAEGAGIIRVARTNGADVFYGRLHAGLPVEGVIISAENNWRPLSRFDRTLHQDANAPAELLQDIKLYQTAAAGAQVASRYYAAHGNRQSAAFYAAEAKRLAQGIGE